MGGFLGEKCCGHFSITKHQYPKKQLQWIVWGLWPSCTDQLFFLISYYFLLDLRLGARCSLEVSEIVITECRNREEGENVMASGSSKDVSNFSVSMESKPCSKLATAQCIKE